MKIHTLGATLLLATALSCGSPQADAKKANCDTTVEVTQARFDLLSEGDSVEEVRKTFRGTKAQVLTESDRVIIYGFGWRSCSPNRAKVTFYKESYGRTSLVQKAFFS